jgi:hypothetical protein
MTWNHPRTSGANLEEQGKSEEEGRAGGAMRMSMSAQSPCVGCEASFAGDLRESAMLGCASLCWVATGALGKLLIS